MEANVTYVSLISSSTSLSLHVSICLCQMEDVMLVSNKYKQLYECRLPAQAVRFHQDPVPEADSQGYSGPGVPELLKPMQTAPCLVKVSTLTLLVHPTNKNINPVITHSPIGLTELLTLVK